jgi:hypothetical protein
MFQLENKIDLIYLFFWECGILDVPHFSEEAFLVSDDDLKDGLKRVLDGGSEYS